MVHSNTPKAPLHRVDVYEVRLVKTRRPLRLAERCLSHSAASALALHSLIGLTDREHLACLFVDGGWSVTGAHIVAIGGQHQIGAVEARVILRAALAACASYLIIGHNHTGGDPWPSEEDILATARIQHAARVVGIPLADHVIVTRNPNRYHSMSANGTMATDIDV